MSADDGDDPVIEIQNVSKRYDDVVALDGVSLSIPRGEVFGLLGPNGAGKTTLFEILTTVSDPTSGTASIEGFDILTEREQVRQRINYVPQKTAVDDWQTGRQLLKLFARFYSVLAGDVDRKCEQALRAVDLADAADRKIETYSGGMKRRLEIATTLIHKPAVVLLDEPTIGLDPRMRREIWKYVRKIQSEGVTLFLATHYLDEADALCDRVAVMDGGEVVAVDDPASMKSQGDGVEDLALDEAFIELLEDRPLTAGEA